MSFKEQWPQVYDGISVSECACHGGITYTYTAGTLVGGMIELHLKTNNLTSTSTSMIGLHLKTNNSTSAVGNSHDSHTASDDYLSLAIAIANSVIRCQNEIKVEIVRLWVVDCFSCQVDDKRRSSYGAVRP